MNAEGIRSALAALIAIAGVAFSCAWLLPADIAPIMTASMGASAVLIFAIPFSPLSQPWPVVGGTLLSTAVGIACIHLFPNLPLALAVAAGLAIGLMQWTRSLHPPGGAAALIAVLIGHEHTVGWDFLLLPVGLNVVLLTLLGIVINRWVLRRSYPHFGPIPSPAPDPIRDEDLDVALHKLGSVIDVSKEDLHFIVREAVAHARQRGQR